MRDNSEGGELDPAEGEPTFRRFIMVVQSLPILRVVGRNGEANFPRGPTIRSSILLELHVNSRSTVQSVSACKVTNSVFKKIVLRNMGVYISSPTLCFLFQISCLLYV